MADFSSALAAHTREAERSLVTTAKTAQTAAAKVSDRENDKRARSFTIDPSSAERRDPRVAGTFVCAISRPRSGIAVGVCGRALRRPPLSRRRRPADSRARRTTTSPSLLPSLFFFFFCRDLATARGEGGDARGVRGGRARGRGQGPRAPRSPREQRSRGGGLGGRADLFGGRYDVLTWGGGGREAPLPPHATPRDDRRLARQEGMILLHDMHCAR